MFAKRIIHLSALLLSAIMRLDSRYYLIAMAVALGFSTPAHAPLG